MNSGARRLGSRNLKSNPMKLTALSLFDCDYLLLSIDSVNYTKGCLSGKNRPFQTFPPGKLPTSSTQLDSNADIKNNINPCHKPPIYTYTYITLHYNTLHYITLHNITLHYITYIHTYR